MKRHPVVDPRRREPHELTDSVRGFVGEELNGDWAGAGGQDGAIRGELGRRLGDERLGGRVADRHVANVDALGGDAFLVHRRFGNLLQHLDAVGDVPEHAVLIIERRLIGQDDEELRAGAVGFARDEHGRY